MKETNPRDKRPTGQKWVQQQSFQKHMYWHINGNCVWTKKIHRTQEVRKARVAPYRAVHDIFWQQYSWRRANEYKMSGQVGQISLQGSMCNCHTCCHMKDEYTVCEFWLLVPQIRNMPKCVIKFYKSDNYLSIDIFCDEAAKKRQKNEFRLLQSGQCIYTELKVSLKATLSLETPAS